MDPTGVLWGPKGTEVYVRRFVGQEALLKNLLLLQEFPSYLQGRDVEITWKRNNITKWFKSPLWISGYWRPDFVRRGRQGGEWLLHTNISSSWLAVVCASVQSLLMSLDCSQQPNSRLSPGLWDLWVSVLELRKMHTERNDVWWTPVLKYSGPPVLGYGGRAYWSLGFGTHPSFLFCELQAARSWWCFKFWASRKNTSTKTSTLPSNMTDLLAS